MSHNKNARKNVINILSDFRNISTVMAKLEWTPSYFTTYYQ